MENVFTRRMMRGRAAALRIALATERLERRLAPAGLSLIGPDDVLFEGERADFTLRLPQRSSQAETVFVTTNPGTATYGVDYMAPARQQILFAPGQTVQTFSIATLQEGVPKAEGVETFTVTVTPANRNLSGPLTTTVKIADFQPKPLLSVANVSLLEGESGTATATFTVRMNSPYAKRVSVAYATRDGVATVADADYVAVAGSLEFLAGETTKTVTVTVNGDRKLETDETFSLVLSSPVNANVAQTPGVCTIVNDEVDQPGFQVALKFLDSPSGSVPQSVRTVAQQAVTRWAKILTGDLPAATVDGIFIDDFEMSIQLGLLGGAASDGGAGVLANALPTGYRDNGNGLPYAGLTGLDPADISNPKLLLDTITHEMGHAFGFTRNAAVFRQWVVGDTFVGANALREYNSIFGRTATGVPLQAGGGHWDEDVFRNELMTPETTGSGDFISRITVGALQDMGYQVNYAAAEPYKRPLGVGLQMPPATGVTTPTPTPVNAKPPTPSKPKPSAPATVPVVVVGSRRTMVAGGASAPIRVVQPLVAGGKTTPVRVTVNVG